LTRLIGALALALCLAGCTGTSEQASSPSPTVSSEPAASAAPSSPPTVAGAVAQNLTFTGPAAGTLTTANTQCQYFAGSTQLNVLLTGSLGGQDLTFNIQVNSGYTGPGDYPVGSTLDDHAANLRLQVGSYDGSSATGGGTLVVNADGKSGALKANLSGEEQVDGDFACDKVVQS
jgi:hypothetical protein